MLREVDAAVTIFPSSSAEEAREVFAAADAILVNLFPMTADVIEGLPRCRVISRYGVGYDNVDVEAATRKGIWVARVPGLLLRGRGRARPGPPPGLREKDRLQGPHGAPGPLEPAQGPALLPHGGEDPRHRRLRQQRALPAPQGLRLRLLPASSCAIPNVRSSVIRAAGARSRGPSHPPGRIRLHLGACSADRRDASHDRRGRACAREDGGHPREHRARARCWTSGAVADALHDGRLAGGAGWTCSKRSRFPRSSPLRAWTM